MIDAICIIYTINRDLLSPGSRYTRRGERRCALRPARSVRCAQTVRYDVHDLHGVHDLHDVHVLYDLHDLHDLHNLHASA